MCKRILGTLTYDLIFNLIMVILVTVKHKENISRMLKGTERKVSFKKENKNG